MMYRLALQKSVTVTGISRARHISRVTSDRVWINDIENLILTSITGKKLHHLTDIYSDVGVHTVTRDGELLYIDKSGNINKLSTDNTVNILLIKYTVPWKPQCVYSSLSTGDLLVGMRNTDSKTGKVLRYNSKGEIIQTIQFDNSTGQGLYMEPIYITENRNGDVIVSDLDRGVVVTDHGVKHLFTYTGSPPRSGLSPLGTCTDALSHILVCDFNTDNIQISNQHGHFLSEISTSELRIYKPESLNYDDKTNLLWVGSFIDNKVNIYRVLHGDSMTIAIPMQIILRGDKSVKNFIENLKKGKTTMYHASGMIIGCAGSGKTTLLERLKGNDVAEIKQKTKSTRGIDIHTDIFDVSDTINVNTSVHKQHFKATFDEIIQIQNVLEHSQKETNEQDIEKQLENKNLVSEKISVKQMSKDNPNPNPNPGTDLSKKVTLPEKSAEKNEVSPNADKDSVSEFLRISSSDSDDPEKRITILDFAGQCAYYATHQVFMSPRAFFILVLNMEKKFDDQVGEDVCSQAGSVFKDWTHRDYLTFWVKSIHQYSSDKAPVLIIATHAEEKTEERDMEDFRNKGQIFTKTS
ncbi:uncharacterized protein LOC134232224 isoform X2 [Saccostrea cucullata]|uniref:uncharacterized protein LOC134232224 isoform X2 n=1 Tax=Saccostrea cuccullata TaxID=36930 RepID=UPI002ED1E451